MSDLAYNQLIVVYDQTTNGIVCTANSDAHAAAIVLGMINGKSLAFGKFFNPKVPEYSFNFNDSRVHYQLTENYSIVALPTKFATKKWETYRELIIKKSYFLALWEFRIRQNLNRVNDFYGSPSMMSFLGEQLALCDPDNNYYTSAVTEWADIQDVDVSAAYQELTIRRQGYGLVYLRSHALYSKYTRKISTAKTIEEIREQFELACTDLLKKAQI